MSQEDREILLDYMTGVKQKDIAEKLGISPAAINGRLDTIFLNYRTYFAMIKNLKKEEDKTNEINKTKELEEKIVKLEQQLKSQQEDEDYKEWLKEKEMRKKKKQKDFEM